MCRWCGSSLLPAGGRSSDATLAPDSLEVHQSHDVCPSYGKFCALTDIMEFKLNDIANGLNRKRFADFTAAEMIKLVKALFEDSPRRQTLLASIEALPTK